MHGATVQRASADLSPEACAVAISQQNVVPGKCIVARGYTVLMEDLIAMTLRSCPN